MHMQHNHLEVINSIECSRKSLYYMHLDLDTVQRYQFGFYFYILGYQFPFPIVIFVDEALNSPSMQKANLHTGLPETSNGAMIT